MQRAEFNKPFSTRKGIQSLLELLQVEARVLNQLIHDALPSHPKNHEAIKNTIFLLVDMEILHLSDLNIVYIDKYILEQKLPRDFAFEILHKTLLSSRYVELITPYISDIDPIGMSIDSARVPKNLNCLPQIYYSLGIIGPPKANRFWKINPEYSASFLISIEESLNKWWQTKSALSEEDLKRKLENQEKVGREAEEWVVKRERLRLTNHPLQKSIKRISNENISAGFDIVSFKSISSLQYDRFIEVKSYSGEPVCYISENELETAKELKSNYSLLLVNREKMDSESYNPFELSNPYNILMSDNRPDWVHVDSNGWKISFAIRKVEFE